MQNLPFKDRRLRDGIPDLFDTVKGWAHCSECPICLSRLTTHAMLGNETITNEFYRYILSNVKGNQKSKGKLCPENAYKKKENPECVCDCLCIFPKRQLWKATTWKFLQKTAWMEILVSKEGSTRLLGAGLCWKRMAPNHVGTTGTARHGDSLCCN